MVYVQWKNMMGKGRKIMEEILVKLKNELLKLRWFPFHTHVYDMERRLFSSARSEAENKPIRKSTGLTAEHLRLNGRALTN